MRFSFFILIFLSLLEGSESRIVQRYSKRESELVDEEPVDIQDFENESDLNLRNKNDTSMVLFNDNEDIDELISQATDQPTEEMTDELIDENLADHLGNQQQYRDTDLESLKGNDIVMIKFIPSHHINRCLNEIEMQRDDNGYDDTYQHQKENLRNFANRIKKMKWKNMTDDMKGWRRNWISKIRNN
ncbi:unnamed protein product [Hymenolepis diminuta]|uniref:Uncharacterized protein n=1 Tax=Hymenolepis diminuta TaxID=6216 RepID=A0A564XYM0_HYMDI|nr:unnamed protein product [Hymenolepis diminuta]